VRRDRTDQQPGYKMVALRVRGQCMRRVELIPVGMCTRTSRASPLKAFGHPERIVGGVTICFEIVALPFPTGSGETLPEMPDVHFGG
jgi:hypothetical protein